MVRQIRDEDETIGITEEARESVWKDFRDYRSKRMSLVEAVRVEMERCRKLCVMARNRWEVQKKQVIARTLSKL